MMRNATSTRSDQHRRYTPYGDFCPDRGPWQAFADAHRDQMSGCYMLGNGYRAYSPSLMRFFNPDRLSPFRSGGRNAYAYCAGDPVNRVDPSGARAIRPMNNSLWTHRAAGQTSVIGRGDIVNYAVQSVFAVNNVAGVLHTVVGEMEAIQSGAVASQTVTNRVATIGDFWSYTISLGTRALSFQEISASTIPLEVISYSSRFALSSGISGIAAYAELPGRINQLWQNSASAREFASLAFSGIARASGLDLLGSAAARAGQPLVNAAQVRGRLAL